MAVIQQNDAPPYRPYVAVEREFQLGLKPLDLANWIEIDRHFAIELKTKERLLQTRHGEVFAALPGSRDAQQEVLDALIGHLTGRRPSLHRLADDRILIPGAGREFRFDDYSAAPLDLAGRIVQEDLCILEPAGGRYCLTAASLCAPAYWRLGDKIGKPMMGIHAPVPGWRDRLGPRVDRIFDRLRCDAPVWRLNWSIVPDRQTFTPVRTLEGQAELEICVSLSARNRLYLRVERQTLVRMPRTNAILFTIRTYVTRLDKAIEGLDGALALRTALAGMGDAEKVYKGFDRISDADWDRLLGPLDEPDPS